MTTTLAQMIARCQTALSDTTEATWTEAAIEEWLRDAVKDYSRYIPRTVPETATSFVNPPHPFFNPDFPFQAIVYMMHFYDSGDSWEQVTRKDRSTPAYQNHTGKYYHIDRRADANELDRIELNFVPVAYPAGWISFDYLTDHEWLFDSPDYLLSVIPRDEPILIQYVIWRAWLERASKEAQSPDSTTLLLSTHATNADKAERAYRRLIKDAVQLQAATASNQVSWKMDKWSA